MKSNRSENKGFIREVFSVGPGLDVALVDLFSWWDGSYTFSQMIPIVEFTAKQSEEKWYKLFPTERERNEYWEDKHGKDFRKL